MFKPWDWKLKESRGGPDHFLYITFESGSGESLRAVFARKIPQGYVADPLRVDSYCDSRTAEKLLLQKKTGEVHNIWVYDDLTIENEKIVAESGYGEGTPQCVAALTNYVVELARQRPIQEWQVTGGGQGYVSMTVAKGKDSTSFLEYLKP